MLCDKNQTADFRGGGIASELFQDALSQGVPALDFHTDTSAEKIDAAAGSERNFMAVRYLPLVKTVYSFYLNYVTTYCQRNISDSFC